jgi:hypothetical protein
MKPLTISKNGSKDQNNEDLEKICEKAEKYY